MMQISSTRMIAAALIAVFTLGSIPSANAEGQRKFEDFSGGRAHGKICPKREAEKKAQAQAKLKTQPTKKTQSLAKAGM